MNWSRNRTYSSLLALGACLLIGRCVALLAGGALAVLMPWTAALLLAELALDLMALVASIAWWIRDSASRERFALRAAAAVALVHAVRVLVFVLARTGPWVDFDVRPEQRALHAERWSWGGVFFAGTLAALSIVAVVYIWRLRRQTSS